MFTVYLDESGHSGKAPFADPNQPVFVLAGAWLSEETFDHISECFLALKKRHNVQMDDVKGTKLAGSAPGRRFLVALMNELAETHVPVSLVLIHKTFMGVGVLVEDATDYMYNSRFDMSWTHPTPEKYALMDWMAEYLPDRLAAQYLHDRVCASDLAFSSTALRCLNILELVPSADPATRQAVRKMALADWSSIAEMAKRQEATMGYSPNFTAFARLLDIADTLAEMLGSPCSLVHDEQSEFAKPLVFWMDVCKTAQEHSEPRPYGQRLPTPWVRGLSFAASAPSIGLQVADCIAGAARAVAAGADANLSSAMQRLVATCGYGLSPFTFGPALWISQTRRALIA